jgi:hypothetical protein
MATPQTPLHLVKGLTLAPFPERISIVCPRPGCAHVEHGRWGQAERLLAKHLVQVHLQAPQNGEEVA